MKGTSRFKPTKSWRVQEKKNTSLVHRLKVPENIFKTYLIIKKKLSLYVPTNAPSLL
jgi:hypothetical protein